MRETTYQLAQDFFHQQSCTFSWSRVLNSTPPKKHWTDHNVPFFNSKVMFKEGHSLLTTMVIFIHGIHLGEDFHCFLKLNFPTLPLREPHVSPGKEYTVSISLKRVLRPTNLNYIQNISKIRKNAATKTPNHNHQPLIPNRRSLVVKNDHPLLKTMQHRAGRSLRKPTWRTSWRAWPSWSYVSGWGWPYRFWKHHGGRSFIAPYPCHSTLVGCGGFCWCCETLVGWWVGGLGV